MMHLSSALSTWVLKCALHVSTGNFTRLFVSDMMHLYSALSTWILICDLHFSTGNFTRLFMSDDDAFMKHAFYVDTQMRFTLLYGGLSQTVYQCK